MQNTTHVAGPAGMTIIEALIAVLILGFTTSAIVHLLVTGDRISGRRSVISYATILAQNEAERLRSHEKSLVLPNDTLFDEPMNGIMFEVSRVRIQDKTAQIDTLPYREYAITVKRQTGPPIGVSFRLLQGYGNGTTTTK